MPEAEWNTKTLPWFTYIHVFDNAIAQQSLNQMAPKPRKLDEDYVVPEKYKKDGKNLPPDPWQMPEFIPLNGIDKNDFGQPNLPPEIDRKKPENLFDLLFTCEVIDLLVKSTNAYGRTNPPQKSQEKLK